MLEVLLEVFCSLVEVVLLLEIFWLVVSGDKSVCLKKNKTYHFVPSKFCIFDFNWELDNGKYNKGPTARLDQIITKRILLLTSKVCWKIFLFF